MGISSTHCLSGIEVSCYGTIVPVRVVTTGIHSHGNSLREMRYHKRGVAMGIRYHTLARQREESYRGNHTNFVEWNSLLLPCAE